MALLSDQYQFEQWHAEKPSYGSYGHVQPGNEEIFQTPQVHNLGEGFQYDTNRGVWIAATPMSRDIENLVQRAATNQVPTARTPGTLKLSEQMPTSSLLGQYLNRPDPANPQIRMTQNMYNLPQANYAPNFTIPAPLLLAPIMYKPLAPTAPDKYHGDADIMKYHKYIMQCERFCQEAHLPQHDQVLKCADYLSGKAYKFYSKLYQWR